MKGTLKLQKPKKDNPQELYFHHYDLIHSEYSFYKETDKKGKIQSDVRSGNIKVVLSELPDDSLMAWVFGNTNIIRECWAVEEMRCPYIWNDRNRRIQLQLRRLGLYSLSIDGQWGTLPTSAASTKSNTRTAICNFKAANGLLITIEGQAFNPANYDMNLDTDDIVLNSLVPINVDAPANPN